MIFPPTVMDSYISGLDPQNSPVVSEDTLSNDLSSYLAGLFSSTGENILQSMQFNSTEAQKNRNWQEKMANTAYQRAVADLKAAGLNPLLAYGSAAQAATPSSTAASVNTVTGDTAGSLLNVVAALLSSISEFLPHKAISTVTSNISSNSTNHSWIHKVK